MHKAHKAAVSDLLKDTKYSNVFFGISVYNRLNDVKIYFIDKKRMIDFLRVTFKYEMINDLLIFRLMA